MFVILNCYFIIIKLTVNIKVICIILVFYFTILILFKNKFFYDFRLSEYYVQ